MYRNYSRTWKIIKSSVQSLQHPAKNASYGGVSINSVLMARGIMGT